MIATPGAAHWIRQLRSIPILVLSIIHGLDRPVNWRWVVFVQGGGARLRTESHDEGVLVHPAEHIAVQKAAGPAEDFLRIVPQRSVAPLIRRSSSSS